MKEITRKLTSAVMALAVTGGTVLPAGAVFPQLCVPAITAEAADECYVEGNTLYLSGMLDLPTVRSFSSNTSITRICALEDAVLPGNCTELFSAFTERITEIDLSAADSRRVTVMNNMFLGCRDLTVLKFGSRFDTSRVRSMKRLFYGCQSLRELDLTCFDTRNVNDMSYMFGFCSALETIQVGDFWNTDNVSESGNMFQSCSNLRGGNTTRFEPARSDKQYARIDRLGEPGYLTSNPYFYSSAERTLYLIGSFTRNQIFPYFSKSEKIIATDKAVLPDDCEGLFYMCSARNIDLSEADAGDVTSMNGMFYDCMQLEEADLAGLNTGNVTDMGCMFRGCSALRTLDVTGMDTSAVSNMSEMFKSCNQLVELDLSTFSTPALTEMKEMFYECGAQEIKFGKDFDTSRITDMSSLFSNCYPLESVDLTGFVTDNVTTMEKMFEGCRNLKELDLSSFDTSSVNSISRMFCDCLHLSTIYVSRKWTNENITDKNEVIFPNCNNLMGGNGTRYGIKQSEVDSARIDTPGTPGLLSIVRPEFTTNSVTLGGTLYLNFYVMMNTIPEESMNDVSVEFTVEGRDKKQTAKFDRSRLNNSKTAFGFACKIDSVSMADKVTAKLSYRDKDGNICCLTKTTSAEEYYGKFSSADREELWNIITAINDYGYYMQKYLSLHSQKPWTLGKEHAAMKSSFISKSELDSQIPDYISEIEENGQVRTDSTLTKDVQRIYYSLVLDADTVLKLKVKPVNGYTGTVTATVDGKKATVTYNETDGRYHISIPGISAHKLGDMHRVVIKTASGSQTVNVSALSYAYECMTDPHSDEEKYAMAALYRYYKRTLEYNK